MTSKWTSRLSFFLFSDPPLPWGCKWSSAAYIWEIEVQQTHKLNRRLGEANATRYDGKIFPSPLRAPLRYNLIAPM
jgi:hypothetical protein